MNWYETVDGCSSNNPNDFVDDTPTMRESTQDYGFCTDYLGPLPDADTCPSLPGTDPVFNYMNYVDDEQCFRNEGSFTCGQIERMYLHWKLYRESNESCRNSETEIAMLLQLTENFDVAQLDDDTLVIEDLFRVPAWYLIDENLKVLYNSTEDYFPIHFLGFQDTVAVDLCLPDQMSYIFLYEDDEESLFSQAVNGRIEIYRDDKLVASNTGSLGRLWSADIPAPAPPPPPPPRFHSNPKPKLHYKGKDTKTFYQGPGEINTIRLMYFLTRQPETRRKLAKTVHLPIQGRDTAQKGIKVMRYSFPGSKIITLLMMILGFLCHNHRQGNISERWTV